jgi:L-alanine-DL-glutamate epimerase-like enolase superfamily enzyme
MGIGVAVNLRLGVSVGVLRWASVCPVPNVDGAGPVKMAAGYYLDDIITSSLRYTDGHLFVADRPGLGVEVDRDKLKR